MTTGCPCCGEPRPAVEHGGLSVSLDEGAMWQGRQLQASGQELAVLHLLVRRAPKAVHRDALAYSALGEDVSERHLRVVVFNLRRKLTAQRVPVRVETVRPIGYRIVA